MRRDFLGFLGRDLSEQLTSRVASASGPSAEGGKWLLRWAFLCLVVGGTLLAACGYHAGFARLNAVAAAYPDWIWQCLTVFGEERLAFALLLLASLRYPRLLWTLVVAALIGLVYSRGLKALVDSARPPGVLTADAFHLIGPGHRQSSFPSGHSVTAGVFFGVLVLYARSLWLRAPLVLFAVAVGLSRVAVGVHWPVDVAAGLFGGTLSAWLGGWLSSRWPAPAGSLKLHSGVVLLSVIAAITLLVHDGGYPAAAGMTAAITMAALLSAVVHYLLLPLLAYRRSG